VDTLTPDPGSVDPPGDRPVRDLGPIVGREVPGTAVPVDPSIRDGEERSGAPASSASLSDPAQPPRGDLVAPSRATQYQTVTTEIREALGDVRAAHRRGPKPNSRPLPNWVSRLAWFLDDAFAVPGTAGRRVGVDGMLSFVPVAGDLAGLGLSMVVVLAGVAAGVSIPTTLRMLLNVGLESLVGLIPFGGALFDMIYKANNRNVRLIERDLADRRATSRSSLGVLLGAVLAVAVGAAMALFVVFAGVFLLVAFVAWLVG
jgi:hypothetical protein